MKYEFKIKPLIANLPCFSCKTFENVLTVERVSIAHNDDNEIFCLCGDCLQVKVNKENKNE